MPLDLSLQRLFPLLASADKHSLWIADEHAAGSAPLCFLGFTLTNRIDVAEQLEQSGVSTKFSDFDFSNFAENSQSAIYYRISKEKPIVHWVINSAAHLLINGGKLYLSGEKNDGIKTYTDKAATLLGNKLSFEKEGKSYLAVIEKQAVSMDRQLDDRNYSAMRTIGNLHQHPIQSKPGQFGWEKIDKGSELLTGYLPKLLDTFPDAPKNVLDLGCGYGFISLNAQHLLPQARITATDNNAAAILACRENFHRRNIQGNVIADNCAQGINEQFDLILCNPPFHQGFDVESELTQRFINTTRRLLTPQGKALFVVNQFIPLERLAQSIFPGITTLENNGSFKLVLLQR